VRLVGRLLALLVLLSAAVGVAAYRAHREASEPFKGYVEEEIFLNVSPGDSSRSIARALQAAGIINDARLFLAALWLRGATHRLQAGEYRFAGEASLFEVIDRLVRGDVFYLTVTIPEGLTTSETAELLGNKGLAHAEELREVFGRKTLIESVDPEAENLEGYLFPETYRFPRNAAPEDVARALISGFVSVFDNTRREKAEALRLDMRQAVTFASLVEKETGLPEERPLIASVFWNRLERRMPLQSDPTVIYELKRRGQFDGNLCRVHLQMDTPYNTYLTSGLPPGPIASPGTEAIDAVLNPVESEYLYFVSRNDGSHHFSTSLNEHEAAVRRYQVEYFRANHAEQGSETKDRPGPE